MAPKPRKQPNAFALLQANTRSLILNLCTDMNLATVQMIKSNYRLSRAGKLKAKRRAKEAIINAISEALSEFNGEASNPEKV